MKTKYCIKMIPIMIALLLIIGFPKTIYAHEHNENCYGGTLHICIGDSTNGGACYTQKTNNDGSITYVKTCGKTSGRYYNSAGQYLAAQCNKIATNIVATNPTQQGSFPNFSINVTFLDGHTEEMPAHRSDWTSKNDYSNGGIVTVFWSGLVNNAKNISELSTTINFTTPKPTPSPTPTPSVDTTPVIETPTETIPPTIEVTPTPELETIVTPEPTPIIESIPTPEVDKIVTPTPEVTIIPSIDDPVTYDEDLLTNENIEENQIDITTKDTPTPNVQKPTIQPKDKGFSWTLESIAIVSVLICIVISFVFIILYNCKKKRSKDNAQKIDLNNFFYDN